MWKINFILLIFSLTACTGSEQKSELSSGQIKAYKKGIFEVVVLKQENENITYKKELPLHLIPFEQRNDKFISIGTAFSIEKSKYLSAAHVIQMETATPSEDYFLRDWQGKIYKIKNIHRYSSYRDLIEFTLEKEPQDIYIFNVKEKIDVGDIVFTAGNALGEGIVFRKGSVSSFTFEDIDGKWKNIRYDAPASPGNSGGPLLTIDGEVAGIVTMKTQNENLNFALPITEYWNVPSDKTEIYSPGMGEIESGKELLYTWKFSSKLPEKLSAVVAAVQKSFIDTAFEKRDEFTEKFANELFPNAPELQAYLKSQANLYMLSIIDKDPNDKWVNYTAQNSQKFQLQGKQNIYISSNDKISGDYQFFIDKPEGISLKEFFETPRLYMDPFIRSIKLHRVVGSSEVEITSLGEPFEQNIWHDKYGRSWLTASWHIKFNNRYLFAYCLTAPSGLACSVQNNDYILHEYFKRAYKMNTHRMMLSYMGTIDKWQEFMDLPPKYVPYFIKKKLAIHAGGDNTLTLDGTFVSATFNEIKNIGNTQLFVGVEVNPAKLDELIVTKFAVKPDKDSENVFFIDQYYSPAQESSEEYKAIWDKLINRAAPYHDTLFQQGIHYTLYKVLSDNESHTDYEKSDRKVYLILCSMTSDKDWQSVNEICSDFKKGIQLKN